MPWFEVTLTATMVVAVEAESDEDAIDVAWSSVSYGDFDIDESTTEGPIEGERLDSLKRHADRVISLDDEEE